MGHGIEVERLDDIGIRKKKDIGNWKEKSSLGRIKISKRNRYGKGIIEI